MKRVLLIISFLFTISMIGQNSRTKIIGKAENDTISVENAHVINLNSNIGTISNEKGYFEISVKVNDIIQISEINHKTKTIVIDKSYINTGILIVNLEVIVNELDEIIIDNQKITKGINSISLGLPNAEKNPLNKLERNLNHYSQKSPSRVFLDALILSPILNALPYPYFLKPRKGGIDDIYNMISGNRKEHRKLKKLTDQDKLREFNQKEINNIRTHFKDDFFIKNLDLREDKINSFIEFCLPKNIIEYFNHQMYIEIIDVFVKEINNFNHLNSI